MKKKHFGGADTLRRYLAKDKCGTYYIDGKEGRVLVAFAHGAFKSGMRGIYSNLKYVKCSLIPAETDQNTL
jgi:hypothetical protein